jgi:hypothetical protein
MIFTNQGGDALAPEKNQGEKPTLVDLSVIKKGYNNNLSTKNRNAKN